MTDWSKQHRRVPAGHLGRPLVGLALVAVLLGVGPLPATAQTDPPETLALEEVSPAFLGMYRKVLVIEAEIRRYAEQYGVDVDLARAVCLYESGGNADLNSGVGARGYFQVMPATFRGLKVDSNIEAGVKYLSQLIRQFGREDRAIAAYNGGPARISRAGGLPLETLQYVLGVGQFRTLLKLHDASLRRHASLIRLTTVQDDEDWSALSFRLGVQEWELRLHNAFLSPRRLQAGQLIAYPIEPRGDLFRGVDDVAEYRVRHGDNYLHLALTLGVDPDTMRAANGLWHLQSVPVGATLRIPLAADRHNLLHTALGLPPLGAGDALLARATPTAAPARAAVVPALARRTSPPAQVAHLVRPGDTLAELAARYGTTVRALQDANGLAGRTTIRVGQRLQVPGSVAAASAIRARQPIRTIAHRVTRGQTLGGLAGRYGTTISAIQRASGLATRTAIRVGEVLRIPVSSAE